MLLNKKILQSKLKITYDALLRLERWYTGIPIKKYLKSEVFDLDSNVSNTAIKAGRWSSYCHYSRLVSFKNLLEKQSVESGQNVLVHPLLHADLVQLLLDKNLNVISLDIDKNTLAFDQEKFSSFFKGESDNTKKIDLIINFGINGLYEYQFDQLEITNKLTIPTILVIENPNLNLALLKLFSILKIGGVVWNFGDSFLDEQLDEVLDSELKSTSWYISWHIETRMRSILEYHLSDSQDTFEKLFKNYIFLLAKKLAEKSILGHVYFYLIRLFVLKNQIKTKDDANQAIKSSYSKLYNLAIPDLVFDLQLEYPIKFPKDNLELIYRSSDLQSKTKDFYNYFTKSLETATPGSLQIPDLFLEKTYLKYHFYTTEKELWIKDLQSKGLIVNGFDSLHEIFKNQIDLINANFISSYYLDCDLSSLV